MPQTPAITPRPQQLTSADGFFTLSKTTPLVSQSAAATGALSWFADALYPQSGVKLETSTFDAPNAITLREDAALAPEIYALPIAPDGIEICASQASGFLYGLVTLLQTIPFEAPSAPATWLLGALRIEDAPRFGWRGVMLDSAPFSTGRVDQEVLGRARLAQIERAALAFGRRSGLTHRILTLSATDQRERVARAVARRSRNRRRTKRLRWQTARRFLFAGQTARNRGLRPCAQRYHRAGNRSKNLKDEDELQSWFARHFDKFLSARGRRLIGWDEILEGGLAPDATVISWRSEAGGIEAARAGHDVVMAPNQTTYLDAYQAEDKAAEPLAIGGHISLQQIYCYEPLPAALNADKATRVLGAQAQLWTEYMPDTSHVETMAFPRACALAERLWSAPETRGFGEFEARLRGHLRLLDRLGIRYRAL